MREAAARPYQEHDVAAFDDTAFDDTALEAVDRLDGSGAPASRWADAWGDLRRRPLFWLSVALIGLVVAMAAAPRLFTPLDPRFCELSHSLGAPGPGHPFGYDFQGCDIFARTVHGARASVSVGVLATLVVVVVGGTVGALAGWFGGWFDTLLSRVTDVFFAIPLVLAAIVVMQLFEESRSVATVVGVIAVFGWPSLARITRGAVMGVRDAEFVTAATALGASRLGTLARHVIPNAAAPVVVTATVALGTFVVAEATLSFLGIGLPPGVTSWGADIATAQRSLRSQPSVLLYPAGALGVTVLGFIMLGDAVRDALDPRARTR